MSESENLLNAPDAAPMSEPAANNTAKSAARAGRPGRSGPPGRNGKAQAPRRAEPQHPVLAQLAQMVPTLFGETAVPLKRGILQDLLAAHPDTLNKADLKTALSLYTRSTRYLTAMASGQARHNMDGQPVEAVAPMHQYHALLEVFRRRHARTGKDVRAELYGRILAAAEASGLSPASYAALVRTPDEAAGQILDAAMAELSTRLARDEALLRAFDASGKSVNEFADMYGLHPLEAGATLARARARVTAVQVAQAAEAASTTGADAAVATAVNDPADDAMEDA